MYIREEAFPFAGPLAVGGAVCAAAGAPVAGAAFLAAAAAVCAFFRDPERTGPASEALILSPADGHLLPVVREGGKVRLSVFMSVFNVHVNRAPWPGRVASRTHHPGRFMAAWKDKASLDNEQVRMVWDTARGPMEVVQIAGLIARRIVSWAIPGREFERGDRIGLIRFGSRVDLYLPEEEVDLLGREGQSVRAGETPLARWRDR
ncbi:MAG: phosphatidylserine decarboxylase [Acidobacteriota bacterium]